MKGVYWLKIIGIGFIAGVINGLFGAGGGTIIVPALNFVFSVPQHKAHATAISIILPFALVSSFVYYSQGFSALDVTWKVALGGIAGSYIGSRALTHFSDSYLRKIFGVFMILAALRMVF
ncbi:sulfite exporter TauE/SafE family protein [Clostridium formicaceticum]|uniref:Probable membrane transporter protein n=1 Tax=Clostridium formicaceticum TaxID=1497 RepID=A0AAC9RKD7_9CLOT|nr:sulfite exporter TauE/SafE family protein [Clostridium formicaceticum]AOY76822.1 permease [Clostridium formicaceticum]ARE87292.1 Sulfite exporter TauE/SafE [Clostridium formicaceticum]